MTAVNHDHAARLVTHLSQQRSSGKYCDVCVCVAEQRFLAHKCVLSANSDQLDALILDATDEDNASHDIEIEIHGVSPVGFEIVLDYFYTGILRLEPSTVTHAWMTAVYLGLPDIIERCNSYCQQSVCVTAHPKLPLLSTTSYTTSGQQSPAVDASNTSKANQPQQNGNLVQAHLTTNTVLSSATNQPKVNSMVKYKQDSNVQNATGAVKGVKTEPVEIRENQNRDAKSEIVVSSSKKAKLMTMDENAIAWNPYSQQSTATSTTQASVSLPTATMPQVVVNFVQGYGAVGAYQPVEWSGNSGQQWTQLQVGGKNQIVATGMIPIASQIKSDGVQNAPVQILNAEQQLSNASTDGTIAAGAGSPVSYTTLSLVSQDSQGTDSRNDGDTTSAEAATPVLATPAPTADNNRTVQIAIPAPATSVAQTQNTGQTQELNLDNIHFTQISNDVGETRFATTPITSTATFIHPITMINNLQIANADGSKCDTMLMQSQVEQLRIQHQQLQRLRQLETGENGDLTITSDAAKVALATSKRKRKAPTRVAKSEDGTSNIHELHTHNNVRKTKSLADSVLVTITSDHMEHLYKKYPEIKKEPPVGGTCDVMQLLQHGKARQRKSSEQNALNNTIRTILDTTGIVESGDSRVQDAVCLIMDRFTVLQEHMNDAYVRKQLTIKVKHSIHCKKWRLKRHKMKQMEMSSNSSPDSMQPWTSKTVVQSIAGEADVTSAASPGIGATWVTDSSMSNANSIIMDEGLHT